MSSKHVLISCRQMQNVFDVFKARFEELGVTYDLPDVVQQLSEEELIPIIGRYDGVVAGDDRFTARVLEYATRLKIISKWGVGVDGIDGKAAAERNIQVTNTPGAFGEDVADVAAGYLVMLARQLHRIHNSVSEGQWFKHEGVALRGKTLGIAGYGSIGAAVAQRGQGFGMFRVAHDVDVSAVEHARRDGVDCVDRHELFRASDFLVLCLPALPDTRRIVNRETLALMKRGSFLVNVARGGLVDEKALVEALLTGHVAAAALDVFEVEPLAIDHPLRAFPQCVFGSHNGSNTTEAVLRTSERAVENLFRGLGVV
jgi:D-3-phosphoglycerate dehydrogenase / 2-oxoglutarate reductase